MNNHGRLKRGVCKGVTIPTNLMIHCLLNTETHLLLKVKSTQIFSVSKELTLKKTGSLRDFPGMLNVPEIEANSHLE